MIHAIKLNFKTAVIFSLIYSLLFLIEQLALVYRYSPTAADDARINSVFPWPVFLFAFAAIIVWSHRYYFNTTEKPSFHNVIIISLLIIFLNYCFEFLIDAAFYKYYFQQRIPPVQPGEGIIGLMNSFAQRRAPSFSPVYALILSPFYTLTRAIRSGNTLNVVITILGNKIFYLVIILYAESLFFLFRRYRQNPWLSLIPFVNNWILLKISTKPTWWNFMIYIPIIRYFFLYQVNVRLAAESGKSKMYAIGMTLIPFLFYGYLYLNDRYGEQ